jgi:hypothetical protein
MLRATGTPLSRRAACFRWIILVVLIALVAPASVRGQSATPIGVGRANVAVVADGLVNPRGFVWSGNGTLYLGLAGRGGTTPGPTGSPFSGGSTAGVATIQNGTVTPLATGLPSSIWTDIDWVWGVMDLAILNGQLYALEGGGGAVHGNLDRPSGVYQVNADGTATIVADLGAWVDANPVAHTPPEGAPNGGSFFGMAPVGDALWVTDAVNGQVLRVTPAGAIDRVVDLSLGHPVPSGIAADPNGGAYVGTLTAAPFKEGTAKVLHVAADGTTTDFWTGLTTVTAVAVGPDGGVYAAELSSRIAAAEPLLTPGSGMIVRRTGAHDAATIVANLNLPVAARFAATGALYVAEPAFGADDGSGRILRIDLNGALANATPNSAAGIAPSAATPTT